MSIESLHALPDAVKQCIEDESLRMVENIRSSSVPFLLIGGWAARAIVGSEHDRYTFDVDGIVDSKDSFAKIAEILKDEGLKPSLSDWGCTFVKKLKLAPDLLKMLDKKQTAFVSEKCKIKLEFSTPRIYTADGRHFFEFKMNKWQEWEIRSRSGHVSRANVALAEYVVASKLGVSDWKNVYDVGVLSRFAKVESVAEVIKSCDKWNELVLRKVVRFRQEAEGKTRGTAYALLKAKNLDIQYVNYLKELQNRLSH